MNMLKIFYKSYFINQFYKIKLDLRVHFLI